ncbi:MAG: hypothetical protein GXP27_02055 [Planctomycetes bacterium]|nr:hypothetical protein [Planctomycetota bacterium]
MMSVTRVLLAAAAAAVLLSLLSLGPGGRGNSADVKNLAPNPSAEQTDPHGRPVG